MIYNKEAVVLWFKSFSDRMKRTAIHIFLKPWPLWGFLLFVLSHHLLRACGGGPDSSQTIDLLFVIIAQVVGVALVLWALNKNLGLMDEMTWVPMLKDWGRALRFIWYPQINVATVCINLDDIICSNISIVTPSLGTLEERVEVLEKQYCDFYRQLHRQRNELEQAVDAARKKLQREIDSKSNSNLLLIKEAMVGSVRIQVFGALLVIYAALIPVL